MVLIGLLVLVLVAALLLSPTGRAMTRGTDVLAFPAGRAGTDLAILYSGDGGWAPLDRGVTDAFVARGTPVVGVDSLRYFWTARTPQSGAEDLEHLARRYMTAWGRRRLVLLGYSFGAGALPPMIARLPPDLRATISYVALVSPEPAARMQARPEAWPIPPAAWTFPIASAVARLRGLRVACLQGADDPHPGCASLPRGAATVIGLPGGHHYGGRYADLARAILAWGEG